MSDLWNDLGIKNYSNLEYVLEDEVYDFLEKVSLFLKEYNCIAKFYKYPDDPTGKHINWLNMWNRYIMDLINELFNSFVCGNFIAASAMTRTLIESYVYYKLLKQENSFELQDEWFFCSVIKMCSKDDKNGKENANKIIGEYCKFLGICFDEKWEYYSNRDIKDNGWLNKHLDKKKEASFRKVCEHMKEPKIYEDFQETCSYVHAQDFKLKFVGFTFYDTIYNRLYLMIDYIFKTLRLLVKNVEIDEIILELEMGLIGLHQKNDTYY